MDERDGFFEIENPQESLRLVYDSVNLITTLVEVGKNSHFKPGKNDIFMGQSRC